MTPAVRRLICITGPPAAGKTTLAAHLAANLGALVLHPRDVIRTTIDRYPATNELFQRDKAGRVPDESLGLALRIATEQTHGWVILENLPWTAPQLVDLSRLAGDLLLLHLHAPDSLVAERRTARTHCRTCYPLPAPTGDQHHCSRCGTVLTTRDDDDPVAFTERLNLHHRLTEQILNVASKLKVPVVGLDARHSPEYVAREAALAITRPT